MTKMAAKWPKSIRLKNPTLWGRTYLCSPHKGVPPPPGLGHFSTIIVFVIAIHRKKKECAIVFKPRCFGISHIPTKKGALVLFLIHQGTAVLQTMFCVSPHPSPLPIKWHKSCTSFPVNTL